MFYEFKHPVAADYFRRESGTDFAFPAHLHHCFEFLAVTEGEMCVEVDGTEYTVQAGEGMVFFPNQIHAMRTERHSRHVLCLFSHDLVSTYAESVSGKVPEQNLFRPEAADVARLSALSDNPNRFVLRGLLYSLCGSFDAQAVCREAQKGEGMLLHRIFLFIEKNYTGACSLADLSRMLGYDYSYLSRYFRRTVGITYNDYLNQYRISHACALLQSTSMTVLEISSECGFNSLRSLNRNFKQQLGCSPAEYRRMAADSEK